jgi:ribosomal protein S19
MSRSKWKSLSPAFSKKTIPSSFMANNISSRSSIITPGCVGRHFRIHNGKFLISMQIKNLMVGCKFGEVIFTRKPVLHKK